MQGNEPLEFVFHVDNLIKYTCRGVKMPYTDRLINCNIPFLILISRLGCI